MGNALMVCPSSHGNVENLFYGMPPAGHSGAILYFKLIQEARSVSNEAERKKILKYFNLLSNYFLSLLLSKPLGHLEWRQTVLFMILAIA
ncbi:MAG: hypothetical protein K0U52_01985, partial [Gammaproteobacteria bacterium]|nr:hypothetical protein [Gammaproteobacteria bacterium]